MANSRQQKKRALTNEKRRLKDAAFKSSLKRAVSQVELLVNQKDKEKAIEALKLANKKLDKSLTKGVYHKNYISRRKSRLSKLVDTL